MRLALFDRIVSGWRFRGLPTSMAALRYMQASYSQFGEDSVLHGLMRNHPGTGFYIDVGCFHPVLFSNTYRFYLRQWQGICVDPNPDPKLARAWKRHRPRDLFLNLAVSEQVGTVLYAANNDRPQENRIINSVETCPGPVLKVAATRLENILDEYLPSAVEIDILSVDCEGHDLAVLRSNDFARFRPRCLVVEDYHNRASDSVSSFVDELGYRLVGLCGYSRIYLSK